MQNYEVEILVKGSPVKEYLHEGKMFIEGRQGTEFSLRIRNNTAEQVLAVPSVDGLSVMDGEEASFKSGGYVIDGYSSVTVKGWRTSDKAVAAFIFDEKDESYSEKSGKGKANLGVIGVAVFKKKYVPPAVTITHVHDCCHNGYCPKHDPLWFGTTTVCNTGESYGGASLNMLSCQSTPTSSVGASASMSLDSERSSGSLRSMKKLPQDLGTGWGDQKKSEVVTVSFGREDAPTTVLSVYYNSRKRLEQMGIDLNPAVFVEPQGFPGQYCKPPKK